MGSRPSTRHARRSAGTPAPPIRFYERVALALLLLLPILFLPSAESFEVPRLFLLEAAALALGAYAATEALVHWRRGRGRRANPSGGDPPDTPRTDARRFERFDALGWAMLLFLGSALASTVASPNPSLSFFGSPESRAGLVTAISTSALFFASRRAAREGMGLGRVAAAVAIAAAVASAYALAQGLGLDPFAWIRVATYGEQLRVQGTVGHPNSLGAYLAMALPLIVWSAAQVRSSAGRLALGATAGLAAAAIVATLSRAAWLGVGAAGLVAGAGVLRAARAGAPPPGGAGAARASLRAFGVCAAATFLIALALYAGAGTFRSAFLGRVQELTSTAAPTTQTRFLLWKAGLRMLADHPVLGVGLDAFGLALPAYRTADYWRAEWAGGPVKVHNEGIQILATQGIVGGIAAGLIMLLVLQAAWRLTGRAGASGRWGAVAIVASLTALLTTNLAGFTVLATGTLAAVLAGTLAAGSPGSAPDRSRAVPRPRDFLVPGILAAAILIVAAVPPFRADFALGRAIRAPVGSGAYDQALAEAGRLTPWDPRLPYRIGRSLLAEAQVAQGDPDRRSLLARAAAAFRRAIARAPLDGEAHGALARTLARQAALVPPVATLAEVRAELERGIAVDPTNGLLLLEAAELWIEADQLEEARAPALRAARMYPEFGPPLAILGYIALREGRAKDAADTLAMAVGRRFEGDQASEAIAWSDLASAYLEGARPAEARAAAGEALARDPNSREARRSLARANALLAKSPAR